MGDTIKVQELLNDVYEGKVVLPDFQRSFIWEPEDVRQLLVSVLGGYFIGTILMLDSLRDESMFALRLIEGVKEVNPEAEIQSMVKIILDGQQRTTALFYALYEPNIPLKYRKSPYRFYLDINKALNEDWDNAVVAVNLNDKRKLTELENQLDVIPFSLIKNIGELAIKFREHTNFPDIIKLVNDFMQRPIHVVSLPSNTPLERIVETFERINRTGVPLSTFELLTAKLYKDKIKLRDLLNDAKKAYPFIRVVPEEYVLKVIALLRGHEVKRKNLLELKPQNFEQDWRRACDALQRAFRIITDVKDGFGVLDFKKWMPYRTMIVPLAGIINFLKENKLESPINYSKIKCWYWASVFSNRYDEAADTKSFDDYRDVTEWCRDDEEVPDFIKKFDAKLVDLEVDKRSSATYRGVMGLIVLNGAFDFKTGKPPQFAVEKLQDDHIFPKIIYGYNGIANRTLISSNAEKWKTEPSKYFKERLKEHGEKTFKAIMESHLIPEEAIDFLLNDDLENFCEKRKQRIIAEIEKRTKYSQLQ
ncbi:DUF262 domain-containing protein [Candidatus Bathyarchaeota archaeon]|nr:DUF262 domain-containing protein [Candidatus Bathyarchaeota archaeon]